MQVYVYQGKKTETGGPAFQTCLQKGLALASQTGGGVHVIEDRTSFFLPQYSADCITDHIGGEMDSLLLVPADPEGNDLACAVAARYGRGAVCDCTDVFWDGTLQCTRASDKEARLVIREFTGGGCHVASLKPAPDLETAEAPVSELIIEDDLSAGDGGAVALVKEDAELQRYSSLQECPVLVAGGGGISEQADFQLLEDLAAALGGRVCVSRPIVDKGWYDKECQIGLSGKTVMPKLYIAVGVSGAFQHTVGMNRSGFVVAVNIDRNADIFAEADLGIVCDYKTLLPLVIHQLGRSARG